MDVNQVSDLHRDQQIDLREHQSIHDVLFPVACLGCLINGTDALENLASPNHARLSGSLYVDENTILEGSLPRVWWLKSNIHI